MQNPATDGLRGPAEDVYRVTPMHKDSGRSFEQDFKQFSGKKKGNKREHGDIPASFEDAVESVVDDVVLSEKAGDFLAREKSHDGETKKISPPALKLPDNDSPPGSFINLTA